MTGQVFDQLERSRPVANTHSPAIAAAFRTINVHATLVSEPSFVFPSAVLYKKPVR